MGYESDIGIALLYIKLYQMSISIYLKKDMIVSQSTIINT